MLTRLRPLFTGPLSALAFAALAVVVGHASAEIEPGMGIGVDYPNGDISRIALPNPDPGLCRQACDQNGACRGWAFVKPGVLGATAVCALKGSLGPAQADQNVISGVRTGSTFAMTGGARVDNFMGLGMDLPGGDLGVGGTLERGDPALCAQRCEGNIQCQAWTFMRPGGPNQPAVCWLKGSVPAAVRNTNTISARRQSASPPPGGSGFGVWAYVIGANAGNFNDPCQIQYVALAIAGNRYDGNPNYRRVRARSTMEDASNDVTFFSMFMQDQPDGVVKLRPCSPATVLLPPRDGGPGVLPDPVFGVWAYTIGVSTFSDPCAIQYVRSQIAGNRFDSNPRYKRVAAEISGSEASRLVTRFSAFMEDQPDGVVKLISCAEFKKLSADDKQPKPPIVKPQGDIAAWMTGTFDGQFGVTQLTPGGGSYSIQNGKLAVTGIKGATMEGTWTQSVSGGQCQDKTYRGRFRITFTATGFSGLWSYCDQEPNMAWNGTRRR